MARQPYPLEALRKLRDEQAEAQARALASQVHASQAAEQALRSRAQARTEHLERIAGCLGLERDRLSRGELSAADLQRAAEFQCAADAQHERLQRAESEARAALAVERDKERILREQLSQREAKAQLVRNHEAEFREREAAVALQSEEEAAAEQWNAGRH